MKNIFTYLCTVLLFCFFSINHIYCQTTPDTTRPLPAPNAGFDVIIKKNGDILYGLVKEVGQELIKYQRTDIPDGPIYTIPKSEVYAISYRNQIKEILAPMRDSVVVVHDTVRIAPLPPVPVSKSPFFKHSSSFYKRNANVRLGVGFIRSYTGVSQAGQYSSAATFPVISLAYEIPYRAPIRLGIQASLGSHRFSKQQFSAYDSTQSNITLRETIFTLHVYGRYDFAYKTATVQPYILFGLGINSSYVRSEQDVNFINNTSNALLIKSGANSVGIGIMARIGAEYYVNKQLRVFGDVGVGASVLNIGISTNVD